MYVETFALIVYPAAALHLQLALELSLHYGMEGGWMGLWDAETEVYSAEYTVESMSRSLRGYEACEGTRGISTQ